MLIPLVFFISILLGALGAVIMKLGVTHLGPMEINSVGNVIKFAISILSDFTILAGIGLYFLSAIAWTFLLTRLDVSYVQPILSLTYLATPILAFFIIGEHIPLVRWLGIAVVILGVYIIARTA
ncbi:MAG: EamA family transporter [Candidatus Saccharimonadales bacterium]